MKLAKSKSEWTLYGSPWGEKGYELNVGRQSEWQWFYFQFSLSRNQDHAGLDIFAEVLGFYIEFKFYDGRHWNYEEHRYYYDGEEELRRKLMAHFNDPKKVKLWIETPNPLLGDISPLAMLLTGRSKKLLKIVDGLLEGNLP
jgi:hypothetical protein